MCAKKEENCFECSFNCRKEKLFILRTWRKKIKSLPDAPLSLSHVIFLNCNPFQSKSAYINYEAPDIYLKQNPMKKNSLLCHVPAHPRLVERCFLIVKRFRASHKHFFPISLIFPPQYVTRDDT